MSIAITDDHVALSTTAQRFLERRCPPRVARAGLEDGAADTLPPFWAEIAELGWFGLHVPESHGGQGAGLGELAVVLEQLGRAGAPGPWLPTMLAVAAVNRGGTDTLQDRVLRGLVDGSAVGAVGFPGSTRLVASQPDESGTVTLSGSCRPIPGALLATWLILPAVGPDGSEEWWVAPASDVKVEELPGLDPTWRPATVHAESLVLSPDHRLALRRNEMDALTAVLVSAASAGGAGWCVDAAAAYAKTREQFGRPIGQFQGVKHRCADMLILAEQARAAAWDAANAFDRADDPDEVALAAAIAGAVAPSAFADAAKSCIQVHGGIGFTWEHDAHRYLRRAVATRQLMGGTVPWRRRISSLATAGVRRRLDDAGMIEDRQLQASIRAEAEAIAAGPREGHRAALVDAGLFVPHWPAPWGRAAGAVEQLIIDEELRRAKLRRPHLAVGAWAAPTIASRGTPEQQERWVRPTLLGELKWCQLFSEPDAGSDLASLTTRASRTEGGWVLDGQKVWTTMARDADWGICLARTDPDVPKHEGITYFIVDMHSPGLEIRPLRELTGLSMFNEVFFTRVFVPDDCVIGAVGDGWSLARITLGNERVSMGSGSSFGGGLESLLQLVAAVSPSGDVDPVTVDALGALIAEAQTVGLLGLRSTHRAVAGGGPGPESSVRKLLAAEHDQRTQEFGLSLLGGEGATTEGLAAQWTYGFLANRCLTIAGGTSEVQRNVIAERLLGLPRDPEPGD